MMSTIREVSRSSDAWKLLRGLVCLVKPPDFSIRSLQDRVETALTDQLNHMEKSERTRRLLQDPEFDRMAKISQGKGFLSTVLGSHSNLVADYSEHPLVLGDLFQREDARTVVVNRLDYRMSGLTLLAVNDHVLASSLRSANLLKTYRVRLEFGRATDTGFHDGKVLEKTRNPHLREPMVTKALASIQGSHQREAFKHARVSLQSQEAYELAVKGPVRPAEGQNTGGAIMYNLKCVEFKPPLMELEMTCLNEDMNFITGLGSELGWRLKTTAVCLGVRCLRCGFFGLDNALLLKHVDLENVLNNVYENKRLIDENNMVLEKNLEFKEQKKLT